MNDRPETYYKNERKEMLAFIPKCSNKILEVGCGDGAFGSLLKKEREAEVWGVEISEAAARSAYANIDNVLLGNYEQEVRGIPNNYFDCVVFNDSLEHFVDPWLALEKSKAYLKDRGVIVASIPNVRYAPNIYKLLIKKDWHYGVSGILDKGHLKFFTQKSIKRLFEESGYKLLKMQGINRHQSWKLDLIDIVFLNQCNDMKFMQFACLASKA